LRHPFAFEPEEARRLARRLGIHHTPRHGSWLNMGEILLRLVTTPCISGRFPSRDKLESEVAAWQRRHDLAPVRANWQFTKKDTRTKIKRLYPVIEPTHTS
jgi:hypothetical protein